ncbi:MAG TPA: hypothetical protein VLJ37_02400 [bacterium]|nr:hypothetical protein [bacterium]
MARDRVGGSTPRQPVDLNPTPGAAPVLPGDAVPTIIKGAQDKFTHADEVTGALRTSSARGVERILADSPTAIDPVKARLATRMILALLGAHAKNFDPSSGGSDPNSGVP